MFYSQSLFRCFEYIFICHWNLLILSSYPISLVLIGIFRLFAVSDNFETEKESHLEYPATRPARANQVALKHSFAYESRARPLMEMSELLYDIFYYSITSVPVIAFTCFIFNYLFWLVIKLRALLGDTLQRGVFQVVGVGFLVFWV